MESNYILDEWLFRQIMNTAVLWGNLFTLKQICEFIMEKLGLDHEPRKLMHMIKYELRRGKASRKYIKIRNMYSVAPPSKSECSLIKGAFGDRNKRKKKLKSQNKRQSCRKKAKSRLKCSRKKMVNSYSKQKLRSRYKGKPQLKDYIKFHITGETKKHNYQNANESRQKSRFVQCKNSMIPWNQSCMRHHSNIKNNNYQTDGYYHMGDWSCSSRYPYNSYSKLSTRSIHKVKAVDQKDSLMSILKRIDDEIESQEIQNLMLKYRSLSKLHICSLCRNEVNFMTGWENQRIKKMKSLKKDQNFRKKLKLNINYWRNKIKNGYNPENLLASHKSHSNMIGTFQKSNSIVEEKKKYVYMNKYKLPRQRSAIRQHKKLIINAPKQSIIKHNPIQLRSSSYKNEVYHQHRLRKCSSRYPYNSYSKLSSRFVHIGKTINEREDSFIPISRKSFLMECNLGTQIIKKLINK